MLFMNFRVTSQGAPAGGNPCFSHLFRPRPLGTKDQVEVPGSSQAPFGFDMGVDGPEDGGVKIFGKPIVEPVINVYENLILFRAYLV